MEVLIMELNDKTKNFLDFTKKIMVSRDGKKQYQISSKVFMTADEATYDRWRKRLKL